MSELLIQKQSLMTQVILLANNETKACFLNGQLLTTPYSSCLWHSFSAEYFCVSNKALFPTLQAGIRDRCDINYNTSLGVIFGVPKYAKCLQKVVEKK